MTPRKKAPIGHTFPAVCCAVCSFCKDGGDKYECWSQPPALPDPAYEVQTPPHSNTRARQVDPRWPPCVFFIARESA